MFRYTFRFCCCKYINTICTVSINTVVTGVILRSFLSKDVKSVAPRLYLAQGPALSQSLCAFYLKNAVFVSVWRWTSVSADLTLALEMLSVCNRFLTPESSFCVVSICIKWLRFASKCYWRTENKANLNIKSWNIRNTNKHFMGGKPT
jgi:hypothetical protein